MFLTMRCTQPCWEDKMLQRRHLLLEYMWWFICIRFLGCSFRQNCFHVNRTSKNVIFVNLSSSIHRTQLKRKHQYFCKEIMNYYCLLFPTFLIKGHVFTFCCGISNISKKFSIRATDKACLRELGGLRIRRWRFSITGIVSCFHWLIKFIAQITQHKTP